MDVGASPDIEMSAELVSVDFGRGDIPAYLSVGHYLWQPTHKVN